MKREISSSELDLATQSKRPKLDDHNDAPQTLKAAAANEQGDNAPTPAGKTAPPPPVSTARRGDRNKDVGQHMIRRKTSKSKPSGRTKKCGECGGCTREDCGSCQVCRINAQFKGQLKLGTAECLQKACLNPVPLNVSTVQKGSATHAMTAMMAVQEDGTCPFREVDGQLIDFRCYICKKLPRAGMANRSELYRHYSVYHFSAQLIADFGNNTTCKIAGCRMAGAKLTKGKIADHMGQVHNYVDKYLPEENRIPMKVQRPKGQSSKSRKSGGGRSSRIVFPQIPEGYNPTTNQVNTEKSEVEVEGFKISIENRRTAKLSVPGVPELDYSGYTGMSGCCRICPGAQPGSTIQEIIQHLSIVHRMSIGCIPEPDPIKFLIREGIIKDDNTAAEDNTAAVRSSVETTIPGQIQEQSSMELSPVHGFESYKDDNTPEDESDKEEEVSPTVDCEGLDSTVLSDGDKSQDENLTASVADVFDDNKSAVKHPNKAEIDQVTFTAVNKSLSTEEQSINEGLIVPTGGKNDKEAQEKEVGVYISAESSAYQTKDNPDSGVPSKLDTISRDCSESTGKENIVPE